MPKTTIESDESDVDSQLFDGAETVDVTIQVLRRTYEDILNTIERNGWEPDEGPRILLTMGLGYAQGQRFIEADDEERDRLVKRLLELESVAAVMKFRAFSLMRDNKVLDMRMGALQNTILGLEGLVGRLRKENAALKQELAQLKVPPEL